MASDIGPAQQANGADAPDGLVRSCHHGARLKCRRNGLLVSTEGSTVLLLPSLAIDKRTAAPGWTFWRARYDAPAHIDGASL